MSHQHQQAIVRIDVVVHHVLASNDASQLCNVDIDRQPISTLEEIVIEGERKVPADDERSGSQDSSESRCINIMGGIGVGKTRLTQSAKAAGYATFPEQVNEKLLSDYIIEPKGLAFAFQLSMMQAACMRTNNACSMLEEAKARHAPLKGIVVERAAQENVIFAVVNHACGNISDWELVRYYRYIAEFAQQQHEEFRAIDVRTFTLMPWAPEHKTLKNIIERKRLSENLYLDAYLNELFNGYFESYLEILIQKALVTVLQENTSPAAMGVDGLAIAYRSTAWKTLHVPLLMDWSNYGTWQDVEDKLANFGDFAWQLEPGNLFFVVSNSHKVHVLNTDGLPTPIKDEGSGQVTINLNWYYSHRKSHPTVASAIRDTFFKARIERRTIALMVSESDLNSFKSPRYYK